MKLWCKLLCLALCVIVLAGCTPSVPDATDPTNQSTTPSGTTKPADPGSDGPSKPVDPTDPSDPTNPEQPTNPTDPTDPTDPSVPGDPSDPTVPSTPGDPDVPDVPQDPGVPPADGIYDIGVDYLPVSEMELYNQLFNPNNKVQLDLDMPASELKKLQDDYDTYRNKNSKSPIYRMATLKVTITDAGIYLEGPTEVVDIHVV